MKDELFSIIIPTYNRSHFIVEALDSVISQTYRPIEIVLIDDGSTDNTRNVVRDWFKAYEDDSKLSLRYIYQQNMGPSAARNRGIQEVPSGYVLFFDSDDRLYPQCLDKFAAAFKSRKADLVVSGYNIFDNDTGQIIKQIYGRPSESQLELVLKGDLVVFPLRIAFAQSLVERVGLWAVDMETGEDREFIERAFCLADNPIGIHDILGSIRRGSSGHRSQNYNQACRVRCEVTLLRNICRRRDINSNAINALISRITRIGCKLNRLGFNELGRCCADAVSYCGVPLSVAERVKIILCRSGRIGGILYTAFTMMKKSDSSRVG